MTPTVTSGAHLDVLVVGAGLSGIGAGRYLQTQCPWARYEIFEARSAVGGTWDLFRYPGIRSDSDMHTLGYSFRPWDGEKSIADGASILQYIKDTSAETGIDQHIRSRTPRARRRLVDATNRVGTSPSNGCRTATPSRPSTSPPGSCSRAAATTDTTTATCPDFAGLEDFDGHAGPPAAWPEDLDVPDKRDRGRSAAARPR